MAKWLADRRIYKTAYMAFLLVNIIPMVNHFAYTDLALLAFVIWGVGLLVTDLIKNRLNSYTHRGAVPLLAFYIFCGVSLLLNPHNALLNGLFRLGIFFLCGAVLYITGSDNITTLRQEAVTVAIAYTLITGLMAVISVGMYLLQFQYSFTGPLGENIRIGVWENRLFGLFTSGNVGGSIMAVGLLLSLGLLVYYYKTGALSAAKAALPITAAVFQVWHISLTLSRGTTVSLLAAAVVFSALFTFGDRHSAKELAKRLLCFAAAAAVFVVAVNGLRRLSLATVEMLAVNGLVESDVTGFDRIEFSDTGDANGDISNKRFSIWKASLRLFKTKWLFGTGRNYYEYLRIKDNAAWLTQEDHTYLTWSRGNTHNGYLQILVDGGVLALAAYLAFLVWCLVKNIRAYALAGRWERRILALCLATITYVLVNNLFETNMALMSTNPIQAIFWFVAGVDISVCNYVAKRKEETAA